MYSSNECFKCGGSGLIPEYKTFKLFNGMGERSLPRSVVIGYDYCECSSGQLRKEWEILKKKNETS